MANSLFQLKPRTISINVRSVGDNADTQEAERRTSHFEPSVRIGFYIIAFFIFSNTLTATNYAHSLSNFVMMIGFFVLPYYFTKLLFFFIRQTVLEKVVEERLKAANSEEQKNENIETAQKQKQLLEIYEGQPTHLVHIKNGVRQTEAYLDQADNFFSERAFTPFWDSIEEVIGMLKEFNDSVDLINTTAKQYYNLLEGREHTFPSFPVKGVEIPNPDLLVQRLQQAIARAHRDFQFASIYEQRKTTSAIIAGFRNMQDAIAHLRNDIVSSISDLQHSLDFGLNAINSEIGDMRESQAQALSQLHETLKTHADAVEDHQKFTNEALDNIQNRRKPRS
jgi:hypothetical protein